MYLTGKEFFLVIKKSMELIHAFKLNFVQVKLIQIEQPFQNQRFVSWPRDLNLGLRDAASFRGKLSILLMKH